MDYFRKQRKEAFLNETEFISTDANLLTQVIKTERITALSGLIGKLPEDEQELIRLLTPPQLQSFKRGTKEHPAPEIQSPGQSLNFVYS